MTDSIIYFCELIHEKYRPNYEKKYLKTIKVWRAESNFLRCFEDLFDLKNMKKDSLADSVLVKKMRENINFYLEVLNHPLDCDMPM